MCVQSSFYHQLWINTWRSKFEQETDSILPACWSYGEKSPRSWADWLECATSCTTPAQCTQETLRRSILGRHQSCYWERIHILSDSIECYHPSKTLPAHCIPKVVRMKIGEVLFAKVYMSHRPPPRIFETRMEKRIRFRSRTKCRSWAASQKFPIEPTNSKSNSWKIGATWYHAWRDCFSRWKRNVPFSGNRC